MSWSIVHEHPVPFNCDRCDGSGIVGHAPNLDPEWCPLCGGSGEDYLDLSALTTLARNLAVAALGCAAYDLGGVKDRWVIVPGGIQRLVLPWHPGCGRPAPGRTREEGR